MSLRDRAVLASGLASGPTSIFGDAGGREHRDPLGVAKVLILILLAWLLVAVVGIRGCVRKGVNQIPSHAYPEPCMCLLLVLKSCTLGI